MDLTYLAYDQPNPQLKELGVLIEVEGDKLLTHLFCPITFQHYLCKWIDTDENEEFQYYVIYRVGFVGFVYFFKKERSLRDWFLQCKDYFIMRINSTGPDNPVFSDLITLDKKEFANQFGPLPESYYSERIYSEYADKLKSESC